jgi:hypothetical protein
MVYETHTSKHTPKKQLQKTKEKKVQAFEKISSLILRKPQNKAIVSLKKLEIKLVMYC